MEKVLGLIQKQINVTERAIRGASPADAAALEDKLLLLESDLSRFQKFPEGTKLVRRQDGYIDITISLKDKATLEEVKTVSSIFDGFVERDLMRVGQYGCVIQEPALKYKLAIYDRGEASADSSRTIYDKIKPVPCSVMADNVSLYLEDDVNEAKARAKAEALENKRAMRRIYSTRAYDVKRNKMGKTVVPLNPNSRSVKRVTRRMKLSELAEPMDS
ncbi:hypothetical protein O3W44_21895 [Pantoea sp. LMR881]|uniref:hypothetical protein n=1 Tax=Pantoea sp. LMR881 TaxID=3014336 RepID=UPI0022AF11FC|nr:hypothetical protein [Pantoea sp. LMR881]MCZ4061184.1 hypothetical protein [Pantoea sp. LMR881]